MEKYLEFLEMVLPEGTLKYFNLVNSNIEKSDFWKTITIILEEKNVLPELSEEYRWRNIVSKWFKDFLVDDFPIRGKKVVIKIRRRVWKVDWVDKLLKRDIPIVFPWTKLENEFALFLKGWDRQRAYRNINSGKNI